MDSQKRTVTRLRLEEQKGDRLSWRKKRRRGRSIKQILIKKTSMESFVEMKMQQTLGVGDLDKQLYRSQRE